MSDAGRSMGASGMHARCRLSVWRGWVTWMPAAILGLALVAVAVWAWVPLRVSGGYCALDHNAAWIGVEWTSQPVDPFAVEQLTRDASTHHLLYLYPYTTYVTAAGGFNPTYTYAREFVEAFRAHSDDTEGVRLLAWIGVPLLDDRPLGIEGWVDLDDPATRDRIVALAVSLVQEAGFDGVHLDVETVHDSDPGYLLLLEETRAALGDQPLLSVAGSYWLPGWINRLPLISGYKWSSGYYRQVAERVDQIAAMTYDSALVHPAWYRLWMREQTRAIARSTADTPVELLMGVSASRERTLTHRPYAENVGSGLSGICAAIGRANPDCGVGGTALYAAWEATQDDWRLWDRVSGE